VAGGVVADSNVLDNDTLNGQPVDPADVTITSTPTGPLTVNTDGTVSVAPNTAAGTYTIEYTICEVANPTNCDTGSVTVVVDPGANVIDAVDDDFSANPVDGVAGGVVADSNVLDNDTLNGQPVDPADVTITSTPTGPLTVNTDGTVSVAPNTAAGTYTIEYTICEVANPTNCDTGSVTVVVDPGANVIDAVDDDFSANPVDGVAGGVVADSNVLDNDTLNGQPVDPADVTITSTPTGPLTVNDDGTVSVAPNTAAGTYTIEYTICEVANPTNCDTGSVTVVVDPGANVIDAVDDDFSANPVDGVAGGVVADSNVLDNDTLNGQPVDPADVTITSTPTGPLTVNDDGTVSVAPNTAAGTYTIEYTICEVANPTNCDTGSVTVVVDPGANVIDAVDDDFSANPVDGVAGGVVADSNVLDNDTLNGQPVDPNDVTITSTPTGPLTVNDDGTVSVAPDTGPGTYTIDYTICEVANPTNCDTATVTIVVDAGPNIIVLKVDTFNDENNDGYAQVGETISYTFTVTNVGTVPLGNITVTDPLVEVIGGPLTTLEPGQSDSTTFTATYTITQADIDAGSFQNTATVTAFIPDNGPISTLSDDPDDSTDIDSDGDGNPDDPTVTIIVGPPGIDAVDDDFSANPVNGVSGGVVANSNVLDNDTLDGITVDPADVTITSTPTGPLTVNTDGTVSVAPDTAPGTYTIDYTICEVANPDNCDTATVTVVVAEGPNLIDAVDDDFTANPVDGSTGGVVADSNVLDNDTLNGEPVNPADVVITSTPTGPLTVNTDGTVSVAPDTAPGTYTIDYTICEVANPDNCDTATVTVVVAEGPNLIDAVDDDFTANPVDGSTGGVVADSNVLDNDTLNGEPVNPADVVITSTPTGPLTVNTDGTVSVAPDTAPGTYTIDYTICEVANPENCDTATVTVVVAEGPNVIDAVDDDFTANPVDGSTGGVVADSNVLNNDTLNGEPVDPADVVITSTPTGPLTVNADGTVSVAPDTAPGTYTIDYTICEVANPENCDTATVTVEVLMGPNVIDAVDDDFRGVLVDGDAGGLVTDSNVLDNDTLNGEPVNPDDVTITSTPTGPLTVNADGTVSVAPGTPPGTYTIEYTICEIADLTNCDTAIVTVLVSQVITDFKIEVNQMVTPNNDGRNDFLFIRDVDFAKNNTLRIYNRWGIAVFEGDNYNNQNNVFDGRSRGRSTLSTNDYLPAGVYFYIFEYDLGQERITDTGYLYVSK
ncbi:gliding motility-associated C-terminal domain-containing protein, partial [Muriicola sp. SD30]|uniref:T9SS type B sorting domain-containing protein n=1 Tax=Muriicola sp. SD30 TaxID=3240936 RepID=UPI00350F3741